MTIEEAMMILESEPIDLGILDAVEFVLNYYHSMVQCKDCKHWQRIPKECGGSDFVGSCKVAKWMCGETGYCLYGEKNDNGRSRKDTTAAL